MRLRTAMLAGLALVMVAAVTLAGQGFQGGLRGAVKDPGGVVPGVEVTLTNEATNIKRSTTTNEQGEYRAEEVHRNSSRVHTTGVSTKDYFWILGRSTPEPSRVGPVRNCKVLRVPRGPWKRLIQEQLRKHAIDFEPF